jgi:hypothetical protein
MLQLGTMALSTRTKRKSRSCAAKLGLDYSKVKLKSQRGEGTDDPGIFMWTHNKISIQRSGLAQGRNDESPGIRMFGICSSLTATGKYHLVPAKGKRTHKANLTDYV